jgi:hypothetical protein
MLSDREEVLTDATFPYEFSLPLKPTEQPASLRFQATTSDGKLHRGDVIRWMKSDP